LSLLSALQFFFPPITKKDERVLNHLIAEEKYSLVFYDNSLFGKLAEKINEKHKIKSIAFFHNLEIDYVRVRFGANPKVYLYRLLALLNEAPMAKIADKLVALNKRDANLIREYYGRAPDRIVPITFSSPFSSVQLSERYRGIRNKAPLTCLFIGSLGRSKLEGIKWFVENVAPSLNGTVKIVGKGFDTVRQELQGNNVEVLGYIEDLSEEYLNADCVIVPILSGAGMKVKVAEALMYGKTVFGTTEAFEGYDIDFEKIGGVCDSTNEFISRINRFFRSPMKYNSFSRHEFDKKFSHSVALKTFEELLSVKDLSDGTCDE
jgi:hypothetical protein